MRDLEAVEKVRETGGSGMIIGEILCLFLLRNFPILLAPLAWLDGIICHDNRKDLGIPN